MRRFGSGDVPDVAGCDAAVDFTRPDAVVPNVVRCLAERVPLVIGTTGFDTAEVDTLAREAGVPCFYASNFALGAVLMMRFAAEAARTFPAAEIVELHHDDEGGRAVGHGKGDGRGDGNRPADPLRAAARPRGAPGGDLRRAGRRR